MAKAPVLPLLGVFAVGSFVLFACVADDPALPVTPSGTSASSSSTGSTGSSSSSTSSSSSSGSPGDAGPLVCSFEPTPYPCGNAATCYGGSQDCSITGCGTGTLRWECNSDNQCGTVCCIAPENATAEVGNTCTAGKLIMKEDAGAGASCPPSATQCPAGSVQLCQNNAECRPLGLRCSPVKVVGGPGSLKDKIVAVCVL